MSIIAGLILMLAGSGWFAGAATVGTILLVAGAVLLVVQILAFVGALAASSKGRDRF